MSTELYDRVYSILFRRLTSTEVENKFFVAIPNTAIDIRPPIAMQFTCEKTLSSSPNTLDLKLFNLAPNTRAEMEREGVVLSFGAGYADGGPRRLFVGDVTYATSVKKGTEWITDVQVRDGARAFATARADQTFKAGVRAIDVLRFVARSMQVVLPRNVETDPALQRQFAAGYTMSSKSRAEFTRLLAPYGYRWTFQDGALTVLRDDEVLPSTLREISVEEGMVDSPEFGKPEGPGKKPKRTVNSKLYPELQVGQRVNIVSRSLQGIHKIVKLRHTGDFESPDNWKSQIEVEPTK